MLWEFIAGIVTALGTVAGSVWAIKAIVKHEEKACEARMAAFKEGLDRSSKERNE
jgi:hypothetical protein